MEAFGMMSMFELLVGIYLLYSAVTGKGKLYENEYLKCSREEYVAGLRKRAVLTGVLMLISAGLDISGVAEPGGALSWITWALSFSSIILMMVFSAKRTDRAAAKAGVPTNKPNAPQGKPYDPLRAAFVFDDEEEDNKE